MFKRILSALGGKKRNATTTISSASTQTAEPEAGVDGELVTAYDAYGREMKIPRSEWHDKVFLPNLQQKWNDPAELYGQIVSGLNDGFAADLTAAAARLVEIDGNPERSHVIQGIVRMKNGQLDAAEATLRTGMEKAGETGTLLTNLAKVFVERGDETRANETLWRAIQADPNQDNGLLWWAAIQRERGGEEAHLQALRTVASLPGSWRAQLWLARHDLEHKDVDAARALYAEVLEASLFDASALMMISGDLGNNGQVSLMLELVGPAYDEKKHDPMTGLNLLRACQQLGNADEGEALLVRMYRLGIAPIKHHLDEFAQAFQEMRSKTVQNTQIDPDSLKISTLATSQPIWHYGLRDANWLFVQKPEGVSEVGFFALSKITDGAERAESQREDDLGRLTRAIPLYLAEATHYWSDYAANCYIQIVEGGGPVVLGGETDGNTLFEIVPSQMKYFVTGEIGHSGEGDLAEWQVSLHLWNCETRTKQASESRKAGHADLGALVIRLEKILLDHIGRKREQPLDAFYQRPHVEVMQTYLGALGQTFMLTLLANKHMSKSALWGERAMLDWPLTMALQWPAVEVHKLMYVSGLGKAMDYQSDILVEYKERSLQLLRDAREANSPAVRLAPLVWKVFNMQDELLAHIRDLPADVSPAYKAWLERVAE
ncbi:tetratricopeptide repeat protein [Pandoraea sp. NPDC090278]|uniref:tetratricopeptide repeat protein n=1 Tax=Pandoraea sp. NPDC090278 TaxID=3364391 RepID=UPI00383B7E9C